MKVKRFLYVSAFKSNILHRLYSGKLVEGEILACGLRTRPGWLWAIRHPRFMQVCKRCEAAR